MTEPTASRPHMPGYGILPPDEGIGLLSWSWAEERLTRSHDYWLSTTSPDGWPHSMPVWGVWRDGALWFSSGLRSRKSRNLALNPRCVLTTDAPKEPVVLAGRAERIMDMETIASFLSWTNLKYETKIPVEFLDPAVNGTYRVAPSWAFGLTEAEFTGSPTRWTF